MSGIQKLQFSLTKKQQKSKNNKIKTNPLACCLGDPSRDSVPFVFFLILFYFFLFFPLGPIWDLFFWFVFFFNFSSNRGRCGSVTVVNPGRTDEIERKIGTADR